MEFVSIDQFLDSLDGPVESSGSFSLNLDAARLKLRSFQLPDPGLYPVFLVAAATTSNATRFDVWTQADELRFEFNGEPFTQSELDSLEAYLFASDDASPRLQVLAIALKAAAELVDAFEFRSGGAQLSWAKGVFHVCQATRAPKTSLVLPQHQGFLSRFKDRAPDLKETMSVCRFAPLTIRFNSVPSHWAWSFKSPLIYRTLQAELRIGFPPAGYGCHMQKAASPGLFGGAIALVEERDARDLLVVVNGIAYPIPIDAPHLEGVLWHDGLTRDLSCTQLVRNRDMEDFLAQLKGQIAGMVYERVISKEAFREKDRAVLEPLAKEAASHFEKEGDPRAAQRLVQWLEVDDKVELDLESEGGYQAFRALLLEEEQSPRGMAIRSRGLELLLETLRNLSYQYRWEDMLEPAQRMRPLYEPPFEELDALVQCLCALTTGEAHEVFLDPDKRENTYQEGLICLLQGDWERASGLLETAPEVLMEAKWVLAQAYLNHDQPEAALRVALNALERMESVEIYSQKSSAEEYERQRERNAVYRELVADCWELRGDYKHALEIRSQALPSKPTDYQLQAMRMKDIKERASGLLPFWEVLSWQTRCLRAEWLADRKKPPFYVPREQEASGEQLWERLEGYLQHKSITSVELDVEFLFTGRYFDTLRAPFFLGRIAQEMRRRRHIEQAEKLVVRVALLERIRQLSFRVLHGTKKG